MGLSMWVYHLAFGALSFAVRAQIAHELMSLEIISCLENFVALFVLALDLKF